MTFPWWAPTSLVMTMMLRFWPFQEGFPSYSRCTTTPTMSWNGTLNIQRKKQEDSTEIEEKSLSEASWHFRFLTRMTPISPNHDVFTSFKALCYKPIEHESIRNDGLLGSFTLMHRNRPSLSTHLVRAALTLHLAGVHKETFLILPALYKKPSCYYHFLLYRCVSSRFIYLWLSVRRLKAVHILLVTSPYVDDQANRVWWSSRYDIVLLPNERNRELNGILLL